VKLGPGGITSMIWTHVRRTVMLAAATCNDRVAGLDCPDAVRPERYGRVLFSMFRYPSRGERILERGPTAVGDRLDNHGSAGSRPIRNDLVSGRDLLDAVWPPGV
jgi:hypothetical protein